MAAAFFDPSLSLDGLHGHLSQESDSPQSIASNMQSPGSSSKSVSQRATLTGGGGGNRKGNSAERRATHNAIERARRESLNGRFLQLAATLPATSDVRRPSKSLIVNKSLDFVVESLTREASYRMRIEKLRSENLSLREQLNEFRRQAGLEPVPAHEDSPLPPPLTEYGDKKRRNTLSTVPTDFGGDFGEDEDSIRVGGSTVSEAGEAQNVSPGSSPATEPAAFSSSQSAASYNIGTSPQFLQQSSLLQPLPSRDSRGSSVSEGGLNSEAISLDQTHNWAAAFAMKSYGVPVQDQQSQSNESLYQAMGLNHGLIQPSSQASQVSDFENFISSTNGIASAVGSGQPQLVSGIDMNQFLHARLQQPQQQQLHQQSSYAPQYASHAHQHQQAFLDSIPLQSSAFMTVV
ncbi:hypothetical protein IE53DRAFT_371046 [Violaceomyces palustris]|uniref:Uncharacterized protein n=1 Tax=Violaceomyces palustris TaxID=1673888 RepID=A0ACD0NQ59_9BASI|nr:hypothetical protein IE53DRAFT_371046 [Violaceomyces palustris]